MDESPAESTPVVAEVERGAIRRFATALGETDAVFFDVAAARAAGYRDLLAPPSFVATLAGGPVPGVQLPPAGNLNGEQEFFFFEPIVAGDEISVVRRLRDVKHRDGRTGHLAIYTFETEGTNQDGRRAYLAHQSIVVRTTAEDAS